MKGFFQKQETKGISIIQIVAVFISLNFLSSGSNITDMDIMDLTKKVHICNSQPILLDIVHRRFRRI